MFNTQKELTKLGYYARKGSNGINIFKNGGEKIGEISQEELLQNQTGELTLELIKTKCQI